MRAARGRAPGAGGAWPLNLAQGAKGRIVTGRQGVSSTRLSRCRACGQAIMFAVVSNKLGKPPSRMPLNPDPDPAGNVASYRDGTGTRVGRVLGKGGRVLGYERVYMPHFATCEKKGEGRKSAPAAPPPGVASLSAWRERKARKPIRQLGDGTR